MPAVSQLNVQAVLPAQLQRQAIDRAGNFARRLRQVGSGISGLYRS
jgi:hypothetical protein